MDEQTYIQVYRYIEVDTEMEIEIEREIEIKIKMGLGVPSHPACLLDIFSIAIHLIGILDIRPVAPA